MGKVRILVLDVMKPHQPDILFLSKELSDLSGIDGCDIVVYEIDSKVENVKVTLEGKNIDFEKAKKAIESVGATIHSIDKVTSGLTIVKEAFTHQDAASMQ
ncbi:DUF211 domain-containing protein [archaeon]|jgi:uncharacterized protein|nr:DUF211 domain-containing protein [archaeon]MBT4352569.1 DUF211 domain-containing protein [archaeon]MBT4648599.1 DUF211 domain-containing protein [archaeon]MBT6821407.1 DUF211 domain-containing protein [archaeon]MBT7393002.1 DUF211 domain-containing protein [archaeon]